MSATFLSILSSINSETKGDETSNKENYIPFKERYTIEQRKAEFEKAKKNYPNKIPVIVEKDERSNIKNIDHHKFLVKGDTQVSYMFHTIRKKLEIKADEAVFVSVKDTLPPMTMLISQLYAEYKDEDGFLYMVYTGESTFG